MNLLISGKTPQSQLCMLHVLLSHASSSRQLERLEFRTAVFPLTSVFSRLRLTVLVKQSSSCSWTEDNAIVAINVQKIPSSEAGAHKGCLCLPHRGGIYSEIQSAVEQKRLSGLGRQGRVTDTKQHPTSYRFMNRNLNIFQAVFSYLLFPTSCSDQLFSHTPQSSCVFMAVFFGQFS